MLNLNISGITWNRGKIRLPFNVTGNHWRSSLSILSGNVQTTSASSGCVCVCARFGYLQKLDDLYRISTTDIWRFPIHRGNPPVIIHLFVNCPCFSPSINRGTPKYQYLWIYGSSQPSGHCRNAWCALARWSCAKRFLSALSKVS